MDKRKIKCISLFLIILAFSLVVFSACAKPDQPLSVAELIDLGEKYLVEMNYEMAVVQFQEVIEIDPKNPRGYIGLAKAYTGLGENEKAISTLKDGLKAIPGDTELQMMLKEIQGLQESRTLQETGQENVPEPIIVSVENPITLSGIIDRKSRLFANKFNEYRKLYESEDGKTFLSDGTCILFDSPVNVIIDDEEVTLDGAIAATSDASDYIGRHVTVTGYFSKQDYKFQQEITGPHSLAELMDDPSEEGYAYYFNPVGCYLLVMKEIEEDPVAGDMPDDMTDDGYSPSETASEQLPEQSSDPLTEWLSEPPAELMSQGEADALALTAFKSAYFSVDSNDAFIIEIDLPELPRGYCWDVTSRIAFTDHMLELAYNSGEYLSKGGAHLSAPLKEENDNYYGVEMAELSLYITTGEPVNGYHGLYGYSSVKKYSSKGSFLGENGISVTNNLTEVWWETIEFDNQKFFSALDPHFSKDE